MTSICASGRSSNPTTEDLSMCQLGVRRLGLLITITQPPPPGLLHTLTNHFRPSLICHTHGFMGTMLQQNPPQPLKTAMVDMASAEACRDGGTAQPASPTTNKDGSADGVVGVWGRQGRALDPTEIRGGGARARYRLCPK